MARVQNRSVEFAWNVGDERGITVTHCIKRICSTASVINNESWLIIKVQTRHSKKPQYFDRVFVIPVKVIESLRRRDKFTFHAIQILEQLNFSLLAS